MKKEYMKPAVQVVMLKQRNCLLAGSPGGFDGKSIGIHGGYEPENQVDNEDDVF